VQNQGLEILLGLLQFYSFACLNQLGFILASRSGLKLSFGNIYCWPTLLVNFVFWLIYLTDSNIWAHCCKQHHERRKERARLRERNWGRATKNESWRAQGGQHFLYLRPLSFFTPILNPFFVYGLGVVSYDNVSIPRTHYTRLPGSLYTLLRLCHYYAGICRVRIPSCNVTLGYTQPQLKFFVSWNTPRRCASLFLSVKVVIGEGLLH